MLILNNATIVTGDGKTIYESGSVAIDGERIARVSGQSLAPGPNDEALDLKGRLVMPGAINPHSHGGTIGPLYPSGAPALSLEKALENLDTHLRQGTTTALSLDGFGLPEEVDVTRSQHPINLAVATIHWPAMVEAARRADGSGLKPEHAAMNAMTMVERGAVALGEVGAGHTLGGGGVDYLAIPSAVARETGRTIEPRQAAAIKYAVLGRRVQPNAYDREALISALREAGLADTLSPERAKEIIHESVLPSFKVALDGIVESGRIAKELGVPSLIHNSAPSEEAALAVADIAGDLLVAGHSNHPTFTADEAVACARELKRRGAWVEASTLDMFGARRLVSSPENIYAMLRAGLVDIFSTDYAAGHWDGIYLAVERCVADGAVELAAAVAMATLNVVRAVPRLAPDRGEIATDRIADVVVSAAGRPGSIERVYVRGRLVVEGGKVHRRMN